MKKFLILLLCVIAFLVVRQNFMRSEIDALTNDLALAKASSAAALRDYEWSKKSMAERLAIVWHCADVWQAMAAKAQTNTQLLLDAQPCIRIEAWRQGWFVGAEDILKLLIRQQRAGVSMVNDLKARQLDVLCATNALSPIEEAPAAQNVTNDLPGIIHPLYETKGTNDPLFKYFREHPLNPLMTLPITPELK